MTSVYRRKIHFYETDAMRIVHHSNYIRWLEEARMNFLDRADFCYSRVEAEGISLPVTKVSCEYRSMSRYGEWAEIPLWITDFNGVRMTIRYEIRDVETGLVRVFAESQHCFLGESGRPVSLKKACPVLFNILNNAMTNCEHTDI